MPSACPRPLEAADLAAKSLKRYTKVGPDRLQVPLRLAAGANHQRRLILERRPPDHQAYHLVWPAVRPQLAALPVVSPRVGQTDVGNIGNRRRAAETEAAGHGLIVEHDRQELR